MQLNTIILDRLLYEKLVFRRNSREFPWKFGEGQFPRNSRGGPGCFHLFQFSHVEQR